MYARSLTVAVDVSDRYRVIDASAYNFVSIALTVRRRNIILVIQCYSLFFTIQLFSLFFFIQKFFSEKIKAHAKNWSRVNVISW